MFLHSLHIIPLLLDWIELVSESNSWGKLWFSTSEDNCLILWKLFNQNYIYCTATMQVTKRKSIKFLQVYMYNIPMHCHLWVLMVFKNEFLSTPRHPSCWFSLLSLTATLRVYWSHVFQRKNWILKRFHKMFLW